MTSGNSVGAGAQGSFRGAPRKEPWAPAPTEFPDVMLHHHAYYYLYQPPAAERRALSGKSLTKALFLTTLASGGRALGECRRRSVMGDLGLALRAMLLSTAASLIFGVGIATAEGVPGGTLRVLALSDIDRFDPTSAGLVTTNNFVRATQRTLISYAA